MMKILITGICGFVGSTLARAFKESIPGVELVGMDNLVRPGSETNRTALRDLGVHVLHGDIRAASDFESLPAVDWVIDAAANPSVLAGVDGRTSSRQLVEHNLVGTLNMLEYCRRHTAGFILLSTSRVYSIAALSRIPLVAGEARFELPDELPAVEGLSLNGIAEVFASDPPLSLYGTTKRCSESLAIEYGSAFGLPVWINRCGVLAGAGQFGFAEQGIFSFWIHAWASGRPLRYIGFGGQGLQVRDCLHPCDLVPLLTSQMDDVNPGGERIHNLSGGVANSMSLAELSAWCGERFGAAEVQPDPTERAFDVPWLVLDAARAQKRWGWSPSRGIRSVLEEIADFAQKHPGWLELSQQAPRPR